MENQKRVALVTGANRGLGLQTVKELAKRGYRVVLASRDEAKGRAAAAALAKEGLDVVARSLDVTKRESVDQLRAFFEREMGRLDVLVNNAGIFADDREGGDSTALTCGAKTGFAEIHKTMDTNFFGALRVVQALVPLMKKGGSGRVVNVSSGLGQLTEMNGGYFSYRLSKTSLNVLTRTLADELEGTGILVNSVCPGWVRTDMGGAGAELTVEEGASGIVWAATLPEDGPTGGFFRAGERLEW